MNFFRYAIFSLLYKQMIFQDKEFGKNKIMEHREGNRVFLGCDGVYLYEYLINDKRIVHHFGQILNGFISSIATTSDNK